MAIFIAMPVESTRYGVAGNWISANSMYHIDGTSRRMVLTSYWFDLICCESELITLISLIPILQSIFVGVEKLWSDIEILASYYVCHQQSNRRCNPFSKVAIRSQLIYGMVKCMSLAKEKNNKVTLHTNNFQFHVLCLPKIASDCMQNRINVA